MSKKKIILTLVALLLVAGIVAGTVIQSRGNVTPVTTAKVAHGDLTATVSGTGQIKPKTYVNVGATSFGRITHLFVKEGDQVKRGAVLATVENVQPEATVAAQQATISSSRTDVNSYLAAERTAQANVDEAKADLDQALPALNAALDSLNALNKGDIVEIKSMLKPPPLVQMTMEVLSKLSLSCSCLCDCHALIWQ